MKKHDLEKHNKNSKQDTEIGVLNQWKKDFEKRFDSFITNDFHALVKDVKEIKNWLFYGFIAIIGLSILTQIILRFLK